MKRLATFLLFLGVMIGLAVQPSQAMSPAMAGLSMATMTQVDMSKMPDCMAAMSKDTSDKPCKCGMSGCIAMMASGAPMMLGDSSTPIVPAIANERLDRIASVAALRGRSTAPEPEPPALLG